MMFELFFFSPFLYNIMRLKQIVFLKKKSSMEASNFPQWACLTCHSRTSTGVSNQINEF